MIKPGFVFTAILALIFIGYFFYNHRQASEKETADASMTHNIPLPKKFKLDGIWLNEQRHDTLIIEAGNGNEFLIRFHNPISKIYSGKDTSSKYYLKENKLTSDEFGNEITIDSTNNQLVIRSFFYSRLL